VARLEGEKKERKRTGLSLVLFFLPRLPRSNAASRTANVGKFIGSESEVDFVAPWLWITGTGIGKEIWLNDNYEE